MRDFQFTNLFLKHTKGTYKNSGANKYRDFTPQAHPFTFFQIFYESQGVPWEIYESQNATQQFISVKAEEEQSFLRLELEASLLSNLDKSIYINECLAILIDLLQCFSSKEKTVYDNYNSIIINSVETLFLRISRRYPLLLNASSRDYLSFLTAIKEPLHAFKFSKSIDDKHFSNLFYDHIRGGGFVNWSLKPHVFRTLFDGGRLEQKINWTDYKNSLCYLVKLLNRYKIIKKHKVSHWKVVSEFFLVQNEHIRSDKLLNQPPPKDKAKRLHIENFVTQL